MKKTGAVITRYEYGKLVKAKRNKYSAVRTTRHGITFHSKGEADRYDELLLLEKAGEIADLRTQIAYPLLVNGELIATYIADFVYSDKGNSRAEDFKGYKTREYRLKKKLFRAVCGFEILETGEVPGFKVCVGCGKEFIRPVNKDGTLLPISSWRKSKYCSRSCCTSDPAYKKQMREVALKNNYGAWMLGQKRGPEVGQKIASANRGHHRGGWTLSDKTRERMSVSRRGEKSHLWKGGVTPINAAARMTFEYKQWRRAVFERDNFTCVQCGAREVRLHADHIKSFARFPELRLDINNGRTLCIPCHKLTPSYLKRHDT